MVETPPTKEMLPSFIEKPLTGQESDRCADGRESVGSEQGPQMPGGDILPILIFAVIKNNNINEQSVTRNIKVLTEFGAKPGVHRGHHANETDSDCGFADKVKQILNTAVEKRSLISQQLMSTYEENKDKFPGHSSSSFENLLNRAFDKIEAYDPDQIKITGEKLVKTAENSGALAETVTGDHKEEVAFINLIKDTTLDTRALNDHGRQAFNLDLWAAIDRSKKLGLPESDSLAMSLILYAATEIVLHEDKGKPPLPVVIHS